MKIEFTTDNAAFEDSFAGEVGMILARIIERVEDGEDNGSIRDSNGNRVGYWSA